MNGDEERHDRQRTERVRIMLYPSDKSGGDLVDVPR